MEILHLKEYIDKETCKEFADFIESSIPNMLFDVSKQRHILRFGYDQEYPEYTIQTTDLIKPIEEKLFLIFDQLSSRIKVELNDKNDLFLTSFFLSKHLPGGSVNEHADAGEGMNECLKYSCVIYLNDIGTDGAIHFPIINKTILPMAGDVVVFPSMGEESTHSVAEITGPRYAIPTWFTEDKKYSFPYDYSLDN